MDDRTRIGAQAQQLVESLNNSGNLTRRSAATDPETAVARAKILAGCYRKDDAADPETYAMALAAVLAEYTPDIVREVTDPRSGLPSRITWLPSVKDVRDACEEIDRRRRRMAEAAERERVQLDERRRAVEAAKAKPTLAQMKERYGPNWGLSEPPDAEERIRRQRMAAIEDANRRLFEEECRSAGVDPRGGASPSLIKAMKAKSASRNSP